jgi:uncharacterized protein (TIGR03083 family)
MTSTAHPPQGVVDLAGYDVAATVLDSWDAIVALVDDADLAAPTRLDGWTVREVVLHLGTWQGRSAISQVLDSLGSDGAGPPLDADAFNAELVAQHADAGDDEVRQALRASRDAVAAVFDRGVAHERGRDLVASASGPMPLLTVLHAGCYELAVHALDLADALDRACDPLLLRHGVAALADSTGCLVARSGADASVGIIADEGGWAFASAPGGGWTTVPVTGDPHGPRIAGRAADLLAASSGRADPVRLLARRRLKISHVGGLLALTPILDEVPGLPGGKGLVLAAKSLGGLGSLFARKR